ncbi:MAG: RHS repeat domain-containing protein [Myxococcota bacterium]
MRLFCLILLLLPTLAYAEPAVTHETWDAAGRVLRRITTQDSKVLQEVSYEYDAVGRPTRVKTVEGGKETLEKTTFGPFGPATEEKTVDGILISKTTRTWTKGQLTQLRVEAGDGSVKVTTLTYDLYGRVVRRLVVDGEGKTLSETVADIPRPIVPLVLSFNLGIGLQTDVGVQDLSGGFSFDREPSVRRYGADPLEIHVKGLFKRSSAQGVPINDLTAFNLDMAYRQILPRFTLYVSSDLVRNPASNLNVDLKLSPLGARFILSQPPPLLLFIGVAPLWNYRSITREQASVDDTGAEVVTTTLVEKSIVRASLSLYARGTVGPLTLSNSLEFAPRVYSSTAQAETDLQTALDQESILTDMFLAELRLSRTFSLVQDVTFLRDMTLKSRAKYDADGACISNTSLCDGYALIATTSLKISFDFAK